MQTIIWWLACFAKKRCVHTMVCSFKTAVHERCSWGLINCNEKRRKKLFILIITSIYLLQLGSLQSLHAINVVETQLMCGCACTSVRGCVWVCATYKWTRKQCEDHHNSVTPRPQVKTWFLGRCEDTGIALATKPREWVNLYSKEIIKKRQNVIGKCAVWELWNLKKKESNRTFLA